jgi:hypothetical protein
MSGWAIAAIVKDDAPKTEPPGHEVGNERYPLPRRGRGQGYPQHLSIARAVTGAATAPLTAAMVLGTGFAAIYPTLDHDSLTGQHRAHTTLRTSTTYSFRHFDLRVFFQSMSSSYMNNYSYVKAKTGGGMMNRG